VWEPNELSLLIELNNKSMNANREPLFSDLEASGSVWVTSNEICGGRSVTPAGSSTNFSELPLLVMIPLSSVCR
jgi:hypothetical protein